MSRKINNILIANRGEIAVRIAKTLQRMGIAVYMLESELDAGAPHLKWADRVLPVQGNGLRETYLDGAKIVRLAQDAGVTAIHPGYGFLSENADFAELCERSHITFIGPSAQSIAAMGSKAAAKDLMIKAGVPVVPGYQGENQNPDFLKTEADRMGYPVLIKASAGGGGKGMRVVKNSAEFASALVSAKSEALKSFGDDRVILEKYVTGPRHVEFQIFGDSHGHVIHFGERECSIQRRHQKIIEESPSPALDAKLRERMGEAAVAAGKAIQYRGAGTVEFILDADKNFYFMEMNTRLQVEHPVTEWVTGEDLVEWQVRVAQGEKLPVQNEVSFSGHSIECRLYAEDPANGFLPSMGKILYYDEPQAPFVRVDSGVCAGAEIGVNFDPMIAKVSVFGRDRGQAISRMRAALENYPVLGLRTNGAFLIDVLAHPVFMAGDFDTHFIPQNFSDWKQSLPEDHVGLLLHVFESVERTARIPSGKDSVEALDDSPWRRLTRFRMGDA